MTKRRHARAPRLLVAPLAALILIGATDAETRVTVTAPAAFTGKESGRLLLFAEPATAQNADAEAVDIGASDPRQLSIAARDVARFGDGRAVTLDTRHGAYPDGFAALPPGSYRVQAVLDRNGDYNYGGRGPGDLISNVTTIRLPLEFPPTIALDHEVPADTDQFDTQGIPSRAATQILASRAHMHDERIASRVLTRFRGTPQAVRAWVLTPPGYDPAAGATYPTVYTAGGFGATHKLDGQQLSQIWHLMETGAIPPMIWVALDYATAVGTTEFADSASNGPWGTALTREVIPALEARYRMDARPSGRFLTGHSSGGWFALWAMVRYPAMFGGSWSTAPDPVDFHAFLGVDLYAPAANMYRDAQGRPRPLERDHAAVRTTVEDEAKLEAVLGRDGGQLRSFEWVFSPRRADGTPAPLFDRATGDIDPAVARYWREHYDIGHRIATQRPRSKASLDNKIHLWVGTEDSYYLDRPVRLLDAVLRKAGVQADITYVPDATHSVSDVYTRGQDRLGLWKLMTAQMYQVARGRMVRSDVEAKGAR